MSTIRKIKILVVWAVALGWVDPVKALSPLAAMGLKRGSLAAIAVAIRDTVQ